MKALLSTFDKSGLVDFARKLNGYGCELISTGGTEKVLSDSGLNVTKVSELTGFPEILDGRVKTLHPNVYGGLLARRTCSDHMKQLAEHGIGAIDLVVCNLYPFVKTVSSGADLEDVLDNIDIGGPSMIRAAAKNFPDVIVVVDPQDYSWVAEKITCGTTTVDDRKLLARKAFQHVSVYDSAISQYLSDADTLSSSDMPLAFTKLQDLRYGENPHQDGAVYLNNMTSGGVVRAKQLHGLEMSYTNFLDADAAWGTVTDFDEPAATIVKHTNPCGLSIHPDQPTAYHRALEGDPVSAFGGIAAFNREVTAETAQAMRGLLLNIIVAPGYHPEALKVLKRYKSKETRILQVSQSEGPLEKIEFRKISGGALLQTVDDVTDDTQSWEVVTKRSPTDADIQEMRFATKAMKHVQSNSIVLTKNRTMVGMGAGQPNRVTSVHLALRVAQSDTNGSFMASDAFFPFPDGVELAASGGIVGIVQPGGGQKDSEVIAVADDHNIMMVFTGIRHFKH